jgi:hypothetical protein
MKKELCVKLVIYKNFIFCHVLRHTQNTIVFFFLQGCVDCSQASMYGS